MLAVREATRQYESWLGKYTRLNRAHLNKKHKLMKEESFSFMRATFYRWMQLWPETCRPLISAPRVLSVGDLHVENFGTWRDREGRLVWGINDFDEAYPLPYTNDLVRLAASAHIAARAHHLTITPLAATDAILNGYRDGLKSGGRPFVLEEMNKRLRKMAFGNMRNPVRFWEKLESQKKATGKIPADVRKTLDSLMPERGLSQRLLFRISGLGSLGRYRIVAIAEWRGGKIARECKALAPSACVWARGSSSQGNSFCRSLLKRAIRCPDPFVQVHGSWITRRLSPHCCRIPLEDLAGDSDEDRLLYCMGWETANVHLGTRDKVNAINRDLSKRRSNWLNDAAGEMVRATMRDWQAWKNS